MQDQQEEDNMTVQVKKGDPVAQKVARGTSLGARLQAKTDELNKTIEDAEKVFQRLNLGITVQVTVPHPILKDGALWFGKYANSWRLILRDDDGAMNALIHQSRMWRMLAVQQFDALFDAMLGSVESELQQVEAAVDSGKTWVSNMAAKLPPDPNEPPPPGGDDIPF